MATLDNRYADRAAPYTSAAVEITKALFGDREKADKFQYSKAHTALLGAQMDKASAEADKIRKETADGTGGKQYAPIRIPGKSLGTMKDMAMALVKNQLPDLNPDNIPPEAMFNAQAAGEHAYSNSRNQSSGVQAMINSLGIPQGATMKTVDTNGPWSWRHPIDTFGGKQDVIVDPSGQQYNFGKPAIPDVTGTMTNSLAQPSQPVAAAPMPAPAPAQPAAPAAPQMDVQGSLQAARAAIASGKDRGAVTQRLISAGIDPRGL